MFKGLPALMLDIMRYC